MKDKLIRPPLRTREKPAQQPALHERIDSGYLQSASFSQNYEETQQVADSRKPRLLMQAKPPPVGSRSLHLQGASNRMPPGNLRLVGTLRRRPAFFART